MYHTEKEAKDKWCPLTTKHCKGKDCMLFVFSSFEQGGDRLYNCGLIKGEPKCLSERQREDGKSTMLQDTPRQEQKQ